MKKGIIIALILVMLILLSSIDWKVNASTITSMWIPTYADANRTTLATSKTITSNTNNNFTSTKFYFTRGYHLFNYGGKDYTGGQLVIPFNITTPILSVNTSSTITQQSYCDKWTWESIDSNNNVIKWKCSSYNFGVDPSTINDREYIYPTTSIKAKLYTIYNNTSYNILCQVKDNSFYCPISYGQDELDYIEIFTNVNYGLSNITKDYDISIDYFATIEYDSTTSAIQDQTQQQQQQHNEIMNANQTYEDKLDENMNGTNEMNEYTQQEDELFKNIDTNTTALDGISINPNASTFIWDIVNGIRNMNPSIITLITSILGLGIVKLVLNR